MNIEELFYDQNNHRCVGKSHQFKWSENNIIRNIPVRYCFEVQLVEINFFIFLFFFQLNLAC